MIYLRKRQESPLCWLREECSCLPPVPDPNPENPPLWVPKPEVCWDSDPKVGAFWLARVPKDVVLLLLPNLSSSEKWPWLVLPWSRCCPQASVHDAHTQFEVTGLNQQPLRKNGYSLQKNFISSLGKENKGAQYEIQLGQGLNCCVLSGNSRSSGNKAGPCFLLSVPLTALQF
jgi:hypothetical protein